MDSIEQFNDPTENMVLEYGNYKEVCSNLLDEFKIAQVN